jgi:uncharacterized protein (DUF58 family)
VIVTGQVTRPRTLAELLSPEFCARLDRMDLRSRRVFAGKLQGERRSKRRGQSVEFEDYRTYVPGDDLRHLDWNVFARLDRFFIKVFQHEEDLSCHVVLDVSASMDAGAPAKIAAAQRAAMALAYVALVNNNRVAMSAFDGSSLRWVGPMRGRRSLQRLARFVIEAGWPAGRIDATGDAPASIGVRGFAGAMRAVAQSRSGKGVMVLLSDFLIPDGYDEGLRLLSTEGAAGFDTWCLQVLSPGELDPAKEGSGAAASPAPTLIGDLELIDAETGRSTNVTLTSELLARYRAATQAYIEKLRAFCAARGMTHLLVPSDASTEDLVMHHLRARGVLR